MTDFNNQELTNLLQPVYELIEGIVNIVEDSDQKTKKEISNQLISEVFSSTVIIHVSNQSQAKAVPDAEVIKELMKNNQKDEVLEEFTQGINPKTLLEYLEESSAIVMTNYYFQVQEKLTDEKIKLIEELQNKIQESL